MGHPEDGTNRFLNGVENLGGGFLRPRQQVVPELADDVLLRRRPDDVLHALFFRALCFLARPKASVLRSFQNARVNGTSSPPAASPSRRRASSRASSSRACASRSNDRKYSLTLP